MSAPSSILFPGGGVRVGRPNLPPPGALHARLDRALASGWLSNGGPLVREFEARIAEVAGVEHAVAVCNATIGLEIALKLAAPSPATVLCPSFTFAASVQAARWVGHQVRCVDVDAATHLPDRAAIQGAMADDVGAVMGVHLWGQVLDLDELVEVPVIYDAAHAFACSPPRALGARGLATVFSFHATKFLNAFEGGAVVTSDAGFAQRVREATNFGIGGPPGAFGTNGKMAESAAAMGLCCMDMLPELLSRNRENWLAYQEGLAGIPGVTLLPLDPGQNNCQYVVVDVDPALAGCTIDGLLTELAAAGVHGRTYFRPVGHEITGEDTERFPVSARLARSVAILPTGVQLTVDGCARIAGRVRELVAAATR